MYQFEALAAVPSAETSVAGAVVGGVAAGGATGSVVELAEPGVSVVDVCALSPACVDDGVPAPPPVVGDALAAGTVTVTVRSWTTMCSWMTGCATTRSVMTRGSGSGLTSAEMLRPTATRPRAAGAQRATNPGRWTESVSGSGELLRRRAPWLRFHPVWGLPLSHHPGPYGARANACPHRYRG